MSQNSLPKDTPITIVLIAAVFIVSGLVLALTTMEIVPVIIGAVFAILGIVTLIFYIDVKSPNGKYTVVPMAGNKYRIVRRDVLEGDAEQKNRENADTQNGVHKYVNCPNCGALNESVHSHCRVCGKRL